MGVEFNTENPTFGLIKPKKQNTDTQAGAQVAFNTTLEDFTKKGYIAPPGLTEGGSCFTQA